MNTKQTYICVDGIYTKNGKTLLLKRNIEPFKGKWHVPGGHMEENETLKQALKREFKEETNLDVNVGEIVEGRIEHTSDRTKIIIAFKVTSATGKIVLNAESVEFKWFGENQIPQNIVYNYWKNSKTKTDDAKTTAR